MDAKDKSIFIGAVSAVAVLGSALIYNRMTKESKEDDATQTADGNVAESTVSKK